MTREELRNHATNTLGYSERMVQDLLDAYDLGAQAERVEAELRCAKTPVLLDGHHGYTALKVQEMMMAAVSMRSNAKQGA